MANDYDTEKGLVRAASGEWTEKEHLPASDSVTESIVLPQLILLADGDDDYIPVDVYATLMGSRDDRHVAFTKTYDGTSDWSHAVLYEGVLNDDFTEMEGRWSIPGAWSGKFLMIRPEGRRAGILREAFESV